MHFLLVDFGRGSCCSCCCFGKGRTKSTSSLMPWTGQCPSVPMPHCPVGPVSRCPIVLVSQSPSHLGGQRNVQGGGWKTLKGGEVEKRKKAHFLLQTHDRTDRCSYRVGAHLKQGSFIFQMLEI